MKPTSDCAFCMTTMVPTQGTLYSLVRGGGKQAPGQHPAAGGHPADGHHRRGARAIRFVGMRLPLLVPLALFLWIPGVIFLAEIIYQWVSRNRLLLSRVFGCKDACAILPAKKREQDKLA